VIAREEPGGWNLGEWATPGKIEVPPALVSTCYLAHIAGIMAKAAVLVGKADEAGYFAGVAETARAAVNKRFFDAARAQYWEGRQGANAFALACGAVAEEHRKAVFERMVEVLVRDNKSHFDTGIFGTRITLDLLTAGGRGDLAYALMNQRTQPSFGWQIAQGATTLWENWNGESSHNHAMFGGVCQWFYRSLAGINPDEEEPGFRHIVIRPYLLGDLTWVKAAYDSGQCGIADAGGDSSKLHGDGMDSGERCAAGDGVGQGAGEVALCAAGAHGGRPRGVRDRLRLV
jgi:alpha-L-rhamnosidase